MRQRKQCYENCNIGRNVHATEQRGMGTTDRAGSEGDVTGGKVGDQNHSLPHM